MKAIKCDWCGEYQKFDGNKIVSAALGYRKEEEICDECFAAFVKLRKGLVK